MRHHIKILHKVPKLKPYVKIMSVFFLSTLLTFSLFLSNESNLIITRRALAREGDYRAPPVCACVHACVRALVCHADFSGAVAAADIW